MHTCISFWTLYLIIVLVLKMPTNSLILIPSRDGTKSPSLECVLDLELLLFQKMWKWVCHYEIWLYKILKLLFRPLFISVSFSLWWLTLGTPAAMSWEHTGSAVERSAWRGTEPPANSHSREPSGKWILLSRYLSHYGLRDSPSKLLLDSWSSETVWSNKGLLF